MTSDCATREKQLKDVFVSLLKAELKVDATIEHCSNSSLLPFATLFLITGLCLSPILEALHTTEWS